MGTVGRNDPCPCGSGKKYKRCCLSAEETRTTEAAQPTTHALDHRLLASVVTWARERLGPAVEAATHRLPVTVGADGEACAPLQATWLGYHALVAGHRLLDAFLRAHETGLAVHERGWLRAQQRAAFSFCDVARIDLGAGLLLRDLLTGAEVYVREARATAYLRPRCVVCARVVEWNGAAVLVGMHPQFLGPLESDGAVEAVRRALGVASGPVPIERLREQECLPVLRAWQAAVEAEYHKPPPTLVNTDGDPLVFVTDVFDIAAGERPAVVRKVAGLEGAEAGEAEEEGVTVVSVTRPGNAMHPEWTNTIVGRIEIRPTDLRLETNSLRRAAALRRRVSRACKGLATHRERTSEDASERLAQGRGEKEPAAPARHRLPPDEEARVLREMKERQYAVWPDTPIPLLRNATPREAMKRADLCHRVELLLRDLEARESLEPPEIRFDVATLRARLGLPG